MRGQASINLQYYRIIANGHQGENLHRTPESGCTVNHALHMVAAMNGSDILDSRYSWLRLLITLLIATIGNVGMWAVIIIMPDVQAEFGVARADASLPYTLTMVGFALGNLITGRIVDRFGITTALICSALAIAFGYVLPAAIISPARFG